MKTFKQFIAGQAALPLLDQVMIVKLDNAVELYEGRKWVSGRFDRNIGIDQPSHGIGQQHAHVLGRNGDEIVVVNLDGTASHHTKGRLHDDDAEALRARGFKVPDGNIVDWFVLHDRPQLLLD